MPWLCCGSIDFSTCDYSTRPSPLVIAHGFLMFLAWGLLTPIGIIVARFCKKVEPSTGPRAFWFFTHRILQGRDPMQQHPTVVLMLM